VHWTGPFGGRLEAVFKSNQTKPNRSDDLAGSALTPVSRSPSGVDGPARRQCRGSRSTGMCRRRACETRLWEDVACPGELAPWVLSSSSRGGDVVTEVLNSGSYPTLLGGETLHLTSSTSLIHGRLLGGRLNVPTYICTLLHMSENKFSHPHIPTVTRRCMRVVICMRSDPVALVRERGRTVGR